MKITRFEAYNVYKSLTKKSKGAMIKALGFKNSNSLTSYLGSLKHKDAILNKDEQNALEKVAEDLKINLPLFVEDKEDQNTNLPECTNNKKPVVVVQEPETTNTKYKSESEFIENIRNNFKSILDSVEDCDSKLKLLYIQDQLDIINLAIEIRKDELDTSR